MAHFDFHSLVRMPIGDRIIKDPGSIPANTHDLPIGSLFINGSNGRNKNNRYIVTEAEKAGSCKGCDLLIDGICYKFKKFNCTAYSRADRTWVILKKQNGSSK